MKINKEISTKDINIPCDSDDILFSGQTLHRFGLMFFVIGGTFAGVVLVLKHKFNFFTDTTAFLKYFYVYSGFILAGFFGLSLLIRLLYGLLNYGNIERLKNITIKRNHIKTLKGITTLSYVSVMILGNFFAGFFCIFVFILTFVTKRG